MIVGKKNILGRLAGYSMFECHILWLENPHYYFLLKQKSRKLRIHQRWNVPLPAMGAHHLPT